MGAPFTSDALIGVNLTGVDTSAEPKFAALTRVKVYDSTTTTGGREAIYVKTGQVVTVSSNLALVANGSGLVSVSAGGLVGMNAVTTVAGDWIWARTSAPGIA
jgi:hypothetical protein